MTVATSLRPPAMSGRWRVGGNHSLRVGLLLLAVLVLFGLLGPVFLPEPNRQNLLVANVGPGTDGHLLGTDPLGRDLLAWIASAIVLALAVSLGAAILACAIGTAIGLVAGYVGGLVDAVLMRVVDLSLAVPPLVLFIAASVSIEPSPLNLVLLLSAVAWVPYTRLVRAKVLTDRERGYVAAARLAGVSRTRVLLQDLLPNSSTLLLVLASAQVGAFFLVEAGLSFLGLGIQPPSTSLGYMISQGQTTLAETWWIGFFPGAALILLVLAMNLIGDGIRDHIQSDTGENR